MKYGLYGLFFVLSTACCVAVASAGSLFGRALRSQAYTCGGNTGTGMGVTGSGRAATENRPSGVFDSIRDTGCADIVVRVGPAPSVQVQADDNVIPMISTSLSGGVLSIGSKGGFRTADAPKVIVTLPHLARLDLAGSGDVQCSGVAGGRLVLTIAGSGDLKAEGSADALELQLRGSGDADLSALSVRELRLSESGSGDVHLRMPQGRDVAIESSGSEHIDISGSAENLYFSSSGDGDLNAAGLIAKHVVIRSRGSGDARVYATESLEANLSGSGDTRYRGNPKQIIKLIRGSGELIHV